MIRICILFPCKLYMFHNRHRLSSDIQIRTIGADHLLNPVKGILSDSFLCAVSFVIHVHIDKSITLLHFSCAKRNKINRSPHGITETWNMIRIDRIFHGLEMVGKISDPIWIMNGAVFFQMIHGADAVFHHKQRFLISVIQFIETIP